MICLPTGQFLRYVKAAGPDMGSKGWMEGSRFCGLGLGLRIGSGGYATQWINS